MAKDRKAPRRKHRELWPGVKKPTKYANLYLCQNIDTNMEHRCNFKFMTRSSKNPRVRILHRCSLDPHLPAFAHVCGCGSTFS